MFDYHFQEGAFALPETMVDHTQHALEIPIAEGKRMSVVMTRSPHKGRELLDSYREVVRTLSVSMRRYRAEPPEHFERYGFLGVLHRFRFLHETGTLTSTIIFLRLEHQLLHIHVGAEEAYADHVDRMVANILDTLKLRRRP